MSKFLRNFFILVVIILLMMAFSSSYSALNLDNLAYVLAIGIDTSTTNKLKVSFQFSKASSPSESGTTEKTPTFVNTVEASSISNAINLMNGYMGKELNMSHCKVIIFSENFAKQGISKEIYTLINDTQVRPSANIIIAKCDSNYYIEETQPQLENLIAKYYEILTDSVKHTGYVPNATIGDFFNSLVCDTCEPYAILGGISNESSQNPTTIDSQKDYTIKANESSISGETASENIGVAVFKDDKLVGELNALETISFLSIRNQIDNFLISIPDPDNSNLYIDIYVTPTKSTSIKIDTSNGSPYVKIKAKFTGRIYSMETNSNYLDANRLNDISKYCDSYLESVFSNYLYKTSKEFKSDINGFGKFALSNFLTTKDYNNYRWLDTYRDSFFDVKIDTSVKSAMLLNET